MFGDDRQGGRHQVRGAKKKLLDFAAWLSGVGRQSCKECRAVYAASSRPSRWDKTPPQKKEPPCGKCRPELQEENVPAVQIYLQCRDQWRDMRIANSDIMVPLQIYIEDKGDHPRIFEAVKTIIGTIAEMAGEEMVRAKNISPQQEKEDDGNPQNRSGRRR